MTRGVRWYLVGSCLMMLGLAGCARMWFAEREPWRREAEVACLNSGAVKEGPSVRIIGAINGPGVCGADYPLRVAALGEPAVAGFFDEPARPPGAIPGDYPRPQPAPSPYRPYPDRSYPAESYPPPPTPAPGAPVSLEPPPRSERLDAYPLVQPRQPVERATLGRSTGAALTVGPATVSPAATLACPVVSALDRFVTESVQPAAAHWFGQPVVEIRQISAYSCRGMNGDPSARISEHAFGNALDIAAFTLADGRKVTVKDGWHGAPEEQAFLHDVQSAACAAFTTVLAPGSNVYHYDHMHVDLMRRAGGRAICQPATISGDVAFVRAGGRYGRARSAEAYTGSVAHGLPRPVMRLAPDPPYPPDYRHDYRSLPRAIAGADGAER
jgi:extensin-like protein